MAEQVLAEEVVVSRRSGGPLAWQPRVVRGGRGRSRAGSADRETRCVMGAIAAGLALLLLLELHIRAIESPASFPHEAVRAHRAFGVGSMNP